MHVVHPLHGNPIVLTGEALIVYRRSLGAMQAADMLPQMDVDSLRGMHVGVIRRYIDDAIGSSEATSPSDALGDRKIEAEKRVQIATGALEYLRRVEEAQSEGSQISKVSKKVRGMVDAIETAKFHAWRSNMMFSPSTLIRNNNGDWTIEQDGNTRPYHLIEPFQQEYLTEEEAAAMAHAEQAARGSEVDSDSLSDTFTALIDFVEYQELHELVSPEESAANRQSIGAMLDLRDR